MLTNQVAVRALELRLCELEATLHAVLFKRPARAQTLRFDVKQAIPGIYKKSHLIVLW